MSQGLSQLVGVGVIVAVFYLLIIRPQQQRQREHATLMTSLTVGDRVVTAGGLYGTVTDVSDEESVDLQIAEGVVVRVHRDAMVKRLGEQTVG